MLIAFTVFEIISIILQKQIQIHRNMNRRVFITGGAHGIGKSIVEKFVENGDKVVFCDKDVRRGAVVAAETGAIFHQVDVTDAEQLENAMQQVFEADGDIDILVNNVGIGLFKPLTEVSVAEFDQVISTNLRSVFITARLLAQHRHINGNKAYGRIVNLCSTRYKQSEAGTEAYSASKGGIYSLTHALAASLAPLHITVNAIAPGWIHVQESEILRPEDHSFHLSGRVGVPDDIARMCLFICEPENDFINGQTITIDGGATVKMIYPD